MRFASRRAWATAAARAMLAVAGLTMLGQLGRWSDRLDAINIFLPYLIGVAIVAGLLALAAGKPRAAIMWPVAVAALLLGFAISTMVLAEFVPSGGPRCGGGKMRIVQFNLWKDNRAKPAIAAWLKRTGAHLVMLQEAGNAPNVLAELRSSFPYRQACAGRGPCSTVLLSRYPPIDSGGLAGGDPDNRGALSAAWMRLDAEGGPFTAVAVHLGRPFPFRRYGGDRSELVGFVRTLPAATTVVAGDFNLPGWTFQLRRLETALGLERRTRAVMTWPAVILGRSTGMPLLGIDQLFAGRGWTVDRVSRGPFLGSDHYPLIVDLRRCGGQDVGSARYSSSGAAGAE